MSCLITLTCYVILGGIVLKIYTKLSMGWCRSKACLVGKTALVTGGNSGIGYQTALHLASRGCKVIIADIVDSEANRKRMAEETGNADIVYRWLDLSSLNSTRQFADDIIKTEPRLDILINNAGVVGFPETYTEDGILMDMHINHFGPFLLTHLLVDLLKKTPKSRVVFVSSIMAYLHQLKTVEDINKPSRFFIKSISPFIQYSNSKLCAMISVRGFSKKLKKHGIIVNSVHPGLVSTAILVSASKRLNDLIFKIIQFVSNTTIWSFGKSAEEGAQTSLHCAIDKSIEGISGQYFVDCKISKVPMKAADEAFSEAVWTKSEKFVKLSEDEKI